MKKAVTIIQKGIAVTFIMFIVGGLLSIAFVRRKPSSGMVFMMEYEVVGPVQRYREYKLHQAWRAEEQRIRSLQASADPEADQQLIQIVKGPYLIDSHRWLAIYALGERRSRSAVEPIMEVLRNTNNTTVIGTCFDSLGKIGDQRALPLLEEYEEGIKTYDNDPKYYAARLMGNDRKLKVAIAAIRAHNQAL